MARGRKPQATATKKLKGSFDRHPERRNHHEPKLESARPVKTELIAGNQKLSEYWDSFCDELESMGVLTTADRWILEQVCITYADIADAHRIREKDGKLVAGAKGGEVKHPVSVDYHKSKDAFHKLLAELGLTPSARTRLVAAPKEENDPFMDFLNKRKNEKN